MAGLEDCVSLHVAAPLISQCLREGEKECLNWMLVVTLIHMIAYRISLSLSLSSVYDFFFMLIYFLRYP